MFQWLIEVKSGKKAEKTQKVEVKEDGEGVSVRVMNLCECGVCMCSVWLRKFRIYSSITLNSTKQLLRNSW